MTDGRPEKPRYRRAVGLECDSRGETVPIVGVKGEGFSADEIVKVAKQLGVPVVTDAKLAKALDMLDLESEIPEHLYEAVAVLLDTLDERLEKEGT